MPAEGFKMLRPSWRWLCAGLIGAQVVCGLARGQAVLDTQVNPANGHTYSLLAPSTWTEAEARAIALGGHLVTVNDATEEDWVWQTFNPAGDRYIWIGLNDVEQEGQFVWTSGEPVTYTNWQKGQPSASDSKVLGPENYVQMGYGGLPYPRFWNDLWNISRWTNSDLHGVVESSPGPTGPVIWSTSKGGNGHAYELVVEPNNWFQARDRAQKRQPPPGFGPGHLVSISDAVENAFAANLSRQEGTWLGFTDEVVEGEWRWIDNTPGTWQDPDNFPSPIQTAYVNWRTPPGPNNFDGVEDHAGFYGSGDETWNDGNGATVVPAFVVEYEPLFRGPQVASVSVGGLTWSGGSHAIPDGSAGQLLPLPWNRINQFSVVFDEAVAVALDDVRLIGSDGTEYALFGPITSNGPEPGTYRALFMLEEPLEIGTYELRLADAIRDQEGDRLDGEWTDGVSAESGDGIPGGEFIYRFRVLPADVNQDSAVSVLDWAEVRDRRGSRPGDAPYSIFHDIDRRGSVDGVDFDIVPRRAFTFLLAQAGATEDAGQLVVPEPLSIVLAFAAVGFAAVLGWRRRKRI